MAIDQEYKERRVNDLPTSGLSAGDKYALNVGGGKYQTYIVSDTLQLVKEAGADFIEKDTMDEMRALSAREIWALQNGYYKGVTLLGYHEDEPKYDIPINYYLSDTTSVDDKGSVIEVGGIKLEHVFIGEVDVRYYGAKLNSESTDIINICLLNNDVVGIYEDYKVNPLGRADSKYTGGVKPRSNNTLNFYNNAKLFIESNDSPHYAILNLTEVNDVNINNPRVEGDVVSHTGTTGEWGHGIVVYGCENINITNPECNYCWGDGFAIATSVNGDATVKVQNKNVNIYGTLKTWYNRRNGTSLISCDALYIQNIDSRYTGSIKSTAPSYGLDIEPNPTGVDIIKVTIDNIYTYGNKNGGTEIVPAYMQSTLYNNSGVFECKIGTITSISDGNFTEPTLNGLGAIRFPFADTTMPNVQETSRITGYIEIDNINVVNSAKQGIVFARVANTGLPIKLGKVNIINPHSGTNSSNRQIKNAISFVQQSSQQTYGDISIDELNVVDDNNVLITGVYLEPINNTSNKYKNVKISKYKHKGVWSESIEAPVYCNGSDKSVSINMADIPVISVTTGSFTLNNQTCVENIAINVKQSATISLPRISVNENRKIKIYADIPTSNNVTITSRDVSEIINVNPRNNNSILLGGESDILLESFESQWNVRTTKGRIYAQGFPTKGTTAQRPILTSEYSGFFYMDETIKRPVWWDSAAWTTYSGTKYTNTAGVSVFNVPVYSGSQIIEVTHSAPTTINLPNIGMSEGDSIVFRNNSDYNVTLVGGAGVTIMGSTSYNSVVMNKRGESIMLYCNGVNSYRIIEVNKLTEASTTVKGLVNQSAKVEDVSTTPPSPLSAQTVTSIEEAQTAINNLVTMVNAMQANEVELKTKLNAKLSADRTSGQQSTT